MKSWMVVTLGLTSLMATDASFCHVSRLLAASRTESRPVPDEFGREPCTCNRDFYVSNSCGPNVSVTFLPLGGHAGQCRTSECSVAKCEWVGLLVFRNHSPYTVRYRITAPDGVIESDSVSPGQAWGLDFGGDLNPAGASCGKTLFLPWCVDVPPVRAWCGGSVFFECRDCSRPIAAAGLSGLAAARG